MKKNITSVVILSVLLTAIALFAGIWVVNNTSFLSVEVDAKITHSASLAIFYARDKDVYEEDNKSESYLPTLDSISTTVIPIPEQRSYESIRLDIEDPSIGSLITIKEIRIKNLFSTLTFKGTDIIKYFTPNNNFALISSDNEKGAVLRVNFADPHISMNVRLDEYENGILNKYYTNKIGLYIIIFLAFILMLVIIKTSLSATDYRLIAEKYLTFAFLIILVSPTLFILSQPVSNISRTENRKLNQYPDIKTSILDYPKKFNDWFNDRFAWRENFIALNRKFHQNIYGETVKVNEKTVIEGNTDGWLYLGYNILNEGYLNKQPFTKEEITYIIERIKEQSDWLKKRNCSFYLMVVPNKETIYPEYLPNLYVPEKNPNRTDQIVDNLRKTYPDVNLTDTRDILRQEKKRHFVYYKGDTHWNMIGALYGYHELAMQIAKTFPDFRYTNPDSVKFVSMPNANGADLDRMLYGKPTRPREDLIPILSEEFQAANIITKDTTYPEDSLCKSKSQIKINPTAKKKRKILIFRDSFSNSFINYLAQQGDTTILLWTHQFTPAILEQEKPDIVVHEILERFLPEFLEQVPLDGSKKSYAARKGINEIKE